MDRMLAAVADSPVFTATRAPYLLLDRGLVIRAVNDAYVRATGRARDELVGAPMFDAFPDNPEDPDADGVRNLAASLGVVLGHGRRHDMLIQRYDVSDGHGGPFARKVWSPVNSPIPGTGGLVVGALHHVEDLTEVPLLDPAAERPDVEAVRAALVAAERYRAAHAAMAEENRQLRDVVGALLGARTRGGRMGRRLGLLWGQVSARARSLGWPTAICASVVDLLPVVAGAALAVHGSGGLVETVAVSDPWTQLLEELHYTAGEGPGPEAFRSVLPVLVPDLVAERSRWPGFTDLVAGTGLAAVFSFPVAAGHNPLGTLTVYVRERVRLSATEVNDVAALAELAAATLLTELEPASATDDHPADRYRDVNIAAGILSEELGVDIDDALGRLRAHAFAHTRPVVDVAREIIARRLHLE